MKEKEYDLAIKGASLIKEFTHPNLIKGEDWFEENVDGSDCLMIVFEYCPVSVWVCFKRKSKFISRLNFYEKKQHGDLKKNISILKDIDSYLDIDIQKRWTRQLISVIKFLSGTQVIHRNIKPSNILVYEKQDANGTNYNLKLGDFGYAREFGETHLKQKLIFLKW